MSNAIPYDRHDRTSIFQADSHQDSAQAHQVFAQLIGSIALVQATIDEPDLLTQNPFVLLTVHASRFPNGITITDCGIITHPSSTYSVDFKKYTNPADGAPVTIETVATDGSQEAEDDGTIDNPDISAGDIIYVNLPSGDLDQLSVWMTFTID